MYLQYFISLFRVVGGNGILFFAKVSAENQGLYNCVATTKTEKFERLIEVEVVNYPYFLDMSRDQAIEIGTNASIRCLVSDPSNAIVFWTFDQKPVLSSERITLHEQDTLLEIGNFTETDNGIYSCHLSNPMNNEISTFPFKVFASGKQWINRNEFISF
jgi:hypothetical protein